MFLSVVIQIKSCYKFRNITFATPSDKASILSGCNLYIRPSSEAFVSKRSSTGVKSLELGNIMPVL